MNTPRIFSVFEKYRRRGQRRTSLIDRGRTSYRLGLRCVSALEKKCYWVKAAELYEEALLAAGERGSGEDWLLLSSVCVPI